MSNLLLVDANLLAHRCHKNGLELDNGEGVPTGLEYGFLRSLESLEKKYPEHRIILCWDSPTAAAKRREKCAAYKANRNPDNDTNTALYPRIAVLRARYLSHFYAEAQVDGLEADDVIFALSQSIGQHFILSNDKDLLQAVNDYVTVLKQGFGGKMHPWGPEEVWEKFKVWPYALPLLRAVLGDPSDNLKGCASLGKEQTAEYVRAVYLRWQKESEAPPPAVERSPDDPIDALLAVVTPEQHRFSAVKWAIWEAFVDGGQLRTNFGLMRLNYHEVEVVEPTGESPVVIEYLREMKFKSLRRSQQLGAFDEDFADEEF